MIKRIFALITCTVFCAVILSSCVAQPNKAERAETEIACTVYPIYDWLTNITANTSDVNVRLIAKRGVDMHSFQPSAKDIADINSADLFVYLGGNSDKWASDAAKNMLQSNSLCIFEVLDGELAEENNNTTATGHEHHEHEHGAHEEYAGAGSHSKDEHGGETDADVRGGAKEYDEHIWMSLRLAEKTVSALCAKLSELFPQNADIYGKNAAEYADELRKLDAEYKAAAEGSRDKTIVLADRFPLLYLTNDYGITCYAAFPGCTTDTAASFETMVFLIEKMNEYKKDTVLVLENSDFSAAKTVISGSERRDARILVINSCQSPPLEGAVNTDYLTLMRENLEVLKCALG